MPTLKHSLPNGLLPTPQTVDAGEPRALRMKKDTKRNPLSPGSWRGDLKDHIAASTFSPADSPASLFPPQDEDAERKTTATSGRTCYDLYARHVLTSSWARTLAASLLGTEVWYSSKCSLTWKLRATKRGRSLFQLAPSALPIDAIGYGLLRTPSASDAEGGVMEIRPGADARYKLRDEIPHFGKMLPTPRSGDSKGGAYQYDNADHTKPRATLTGVIKMLPTPRASDGEKGGPNARDGNGTPHLSSVVALLPTPTLGGFDDTNARALKKGQLHAVVGEKTGLKLQPGFALWMMGYGPEWLDLEDGEMPPSKARATQSSRTSPRKSCVL